MQNESISCQYFLHYSKRRCQTVPFIFRDGRSQRNYPSGSLREEINREVNNPKNSLPDRLVKMNNKEGRNTGTPFSYLLGEESNKRVYGRLLSLGKIHLLYQQVMFLRVPPYFLEFLSLPSAVLEACSAVKFWKLVPALQPQDRHAM